MKQRVAAAIVMSVFAVCVLAGPSAADVVRVGVKSRLEPGRHQVILSVYATREGGTPLSTESRSVRVDASGAFTTPLGSLSTLAASANDERWLGVRVVPAPETPRVRLNAAGSPPVTVHVVTDAAITANGIIESILQGFRFPDGSVQTSAATVSGGVPSVNGIGTAVTIAGAGTASVSTAGSTITVTGTHGDQSGGTLHATATTSTAGFMSASDKTKLNSTVAYVRTIVVSPVVGDAVASGTALVNALNGISGNSSSNPYLLKIEPGVYDIGASTLTMKPYVDIEGSGEGVTKITGSGHANIDNGTVIGASNAQLRFLTIENTGDPSLAFAVALYASAAGSPTLLNVTLNAMVPSDPAAGQFAYGVYTTAPQLTMRNATLEGNFQYATNTAGIVVTGGAVTMIDSSAIGVGANATSNRGIWLLNAGNVTMIDSSATGTAGGAGGGIAIYTSGTAGSVTLHRAILTAQTGINNTTSSSIKAAGTQFNASVIVSNTGAGSVVCIFSYNSNFAVLNATCG